MSESKKPTNHLKVSAKKDQLETNYVEPTTPFEVIHEDLEMYRAIVDAFKLLSSKHDGKKDLDREKRVTQIHMKKLSLIAIGFDEQLAAIALETTNYDINAAVEYCQSQTNKNGSLSPYDSPQDNMQHQ